MIPTGFKPMLADKLEPGAAPALPCLVSPKLDGIRTLIFDGVAYSRNLKRLPNNHVQESLGLEALEGFDGELLVGSAVDADAFRATTSGIMSADGAPDITFHVFDLAGFPGGFEARMKELKRRVKALPAALRRIVQVVPHEEVSTLEDLTTMEESYLAREIGRAHV